MNAPDPAIQALAAEAERLGRQGQSATSGRLWEQVLAKSPGHPGALNFLGTRALASGDLVQARQWLEAATRAQPPMAIAHANLARVLAQAGEPEAALAALDRALKIEPGAYAAHLEKARLYGQLGRVRDQALAYQSALQLAPLQVLQMPELRDTFDQAQRLVAANQAELGAFLDARLADLRSGVSSRKLARFDECLDVTLGRKPLQLQRPAMFHVTGMPAIAFFEREDLPWSAAAEAYTPAIRAELAAVLAQDEAGFIPYVQTRADEPVGQFADLDRNPDWSAYFLWKHGRRIESHIARCPQAMAMLEEVPQVEVTHRAPAAFFSALKPRTRIPPHNGATNCRLTVHLPLVIPPNCAIRVGNHTRRWVPGELLAFDDTMEHAAWNDSDQLRVVMIFDVWHPMLSDTERQLVRESLEGIMAYYGRDAPLGEL
ncbi:aspartyl/asparaginyl beta-hydroxylase domain-containing protein [Arenimonas sp. MALMAid1274]|uniref:aspartyl/asparaginyl beta-hydroxylase domain-containing protein n=1 Tax=Arenimonas sp. MALMAid1274 TaxID=3411630 RepID=UPI003BA0F498